MKIRIRPLVAALASALLLAATGPALAVDRVAFEFGTTDDDRADADRYGATLAWNLGGEWVKLGQWGLHTYVEAGINVWDGEKGSTGNGTLIDGHVTPVLRLQRDLSSGLPLFVEAGSGLETTYKGSMPSFRIDYILFDNPMRALQYQSIKEVPSDHKLVMAELQVGGLFQNR